MRRRVAVGVGIAALVAGFTAGCSDSDMPVPATTSTPSTVLAGADPCSLTAAEVKQFGVGAGERKDALGARACRYRGDGFHVTESLVEGPGVGDLVDPNDHRLPKTYDSVRPLQVAGKPGQLVSQSSSCVAAIRVGQTSRVELGVFTGMPGDTTKACDTATSLARVVISRLIRGK